MHMTFWFDSAFPNFLFKGYSITSDGGLIATCFGLASLAIFLEIIKVYRASIHQKKKTNIEDRNVQLSHHEVTIKSNARRIKCDKFKLIAVQTSWYTVQDIIGYIVMLAVMTFNGYFTIAVVLGSAIGYFIFGPWLMDIKLNSVTVCNQKQKCASCIAKMEQSHLLSSSTQVLYDAGSNETTSSLMEVAEGLAGVMQNSTEERVAVEVHSHEHCT